MKSVCKHAKVYKRLAHTRMQALWQWHCFKRRCAVCTSWSRTHANTHADMLSHILGAIQAQTYRPQDLMWHVTKTRQRVLSNNETIECVLS